MHQDTWEVDFEEELSSRILLLW